MTLVMQDLIEKAMLDGVILRQKCSQSLIKPLSDAAAVLVQCLQSGGKILACGNGGSAADAQHFVAELVNRFEMNRRALAAISLTNDASVMTSIANDFEFNAVFSRQVEALGRDGDVLLAISTSGDSANVLKAVGVAEALAMFSIALTGRDGGQIAKHQGVGVHINIPHTSTARVQEMHITCLHILCTLIDETMFGEAADVHK
ncbi:MAG: SIS domain-containing protein [Mariprofundaceae bacterium]|nr:SIS domain-containing protein [Mariprofundaceae bacterium]